MRGSRCYYFRRELFYVRIGLMILILVIATTVIRLESKLGTIPSKGWPELYMLWLLLDLLLLAGVDSNSS